MEPQTPTTQTTTTTAPPSASVQMTQNTTPTPPAPPEPVLEPEVKKSNTLLVVLVTFLITALLFVGGYFAYKAYYPSTPNTYVANPTPYAVATSMPYVSPSGSPSADSGKVEGKICYPSEGIPAGKVIAKNISTSELTSFDYAQNTSALSVSLPAGSYYLKYEPNGGQGMVGYYTSCTGSEASCQDKQTKRNSIPVVVEPGKTTSNVMLCDYYYDAGKEPTF